MQYNRHVYSLILIFILCNYSINKGYAVVTVGLLSDGCDYQSLQEAYDNNDPIVHATTQISHAQTFTISKSKIFIGGYDDCESAKNGQPGQNKTIWFKHAASPSTVITINANEVNQSVVTFSNFDIRKGRDESLGGAGGMRIQGNTSVIIFNSLIQENTGDYGGGISIYGENAKLTLNSSEIRQNTANSAGGGVSCLLSATVVIQIGSKIFANASGDFGGGLYASSECDVSIISSDVILNQTTNFGGGIYAEDGSKISITGNLLEPVLISSNKSNTIDNVPTGGAIYATGKETSILALNTSVNMNSAERIGAGLVIKDMAQFTMGRLQETCLYSANYGCSNITNNFTRSVNDLTLSAAGVFEGDASIDISQTFIAGNRAQDSAVFSISNGADVRLEGNLIIANTTTLKNNDSKLINLFGNNGSGGLLEFYYNTVSDNTSNYIFKLNNNSQQTLSINQSILADQGAVLLMPVGINHSVEIDCAIVNENSSLNSLGDLSTVIVDDPIFLDPETLNYHLTANSPAIDYCDESIVQSLYKDIEGNQRGLDIPNVVDNLGVYDLGAFEYQISDHIFINGFE